MKYDRCTSNSLFRLAFIILYCALTTAHLMCDDGVKPQVDASASAHRAVRDLDMKIEGKPGSKVVELTITNHSQVSRFLWAPPDLNVYRINLVDEWGQPLKATRKGEREFTEPGAGSVRVYVLKEDRPWRSALDLGPLFEFPRQGTIRCEVTRRVHFTDPQKQPSESDWIKFPPIIILLSNVTVAPSR